MKFFRTLLYDDWKTKWNKAINFYNRAMWYQNFAKAQIFMPLGLLNETLWILTYLAVVGLRPTVVTIAITYVVALLLLVAIGKILILMGWMKYLQRLGNEQNKELMEILERVKKIEERQKKDYNEPR